MTWPCLSTGSTAVDALLGGYGVPQGHLTELVGATMSGKTALALQCAAAAARAGHAVGIVDSCNGVSVERLHTALLAQGGRLDDLRRIRIVKAFDAPSFLAHLDAFALQQPPRLLVVDSATALIQPLNGGLDDKVGQAMASHIVLCLREFAVSHNCAVVLTNSTLRGFDDDVQRPALGQWWTHVPSVRIKLCGHDGNDGFVAKLDHSTLQHVDASRAAVF